MVRPEPDPRFPGWIVAGAAGMPQPGTWSVIAGTAARADALTKVAGLAPPHDRALAVRRLGGELFR